MPHILENFKMHGRLKETLRESGYSVTAPRRLVFEALLEGPTTYAHIATTLGESMDRATTYRTLDLYTRLGIVNRIWRGAKNYVELSEVFMPHHHHAVCEQCGKTIDIVSQPLEQLLSKIARENNFLAVHHSVEISGYCDSCHKQ